MDQTVESKKIAPTPMSIGIVGNNELIHVGVYFVSKDCVRVLHLYPDSPLSVDDYSCEHWRHFISLKVNQLQIKTACRICDVLSSNTQLLSYGFDTILAEFKGTNFLGNPKLTCVTFCLSILNRCAIKLIEPEGWPDATTEDVSIRQWLIDHLEVGRILTYERCRDLELSIKSPRVTPHQLFAAARNYPPPSNFARCNEAASPPPGS